MYTKIVVSNVSKKDLKKKIKLHNTRKGAILIEFAIAIPLLVMVMFFMSDAPRHYHIKSKMRHSAHFAANLTQNVTLDQANSKVSRRNLLSIFSSSVMSHFNGLQLFEQRSGAYALGHTLSVNVYYVECTDPNASMESVGSNQAHVVWRWTIDDWSINSSISDTSSLTFSGDGNSLQSSNSIVNTSATLAGNIINGFQIARGDAKIIIEIGLVARDFSNSANTNSSKHRFRFAMLPIVPSVENVYYNTVVVLTPRPGLFDELGPD